MNWKPIKIAASEAVRELNEAVECADLVLGYEFDRLTGHDLANVLASEGCPWNAADLRNKILAVEQEKQAKYALGESVDLLEARGD